jgi:hypothetical protein
VFNSGAEFKTQKPLHAGYPLTLVRTGNVSKVLKAGVDYDSGEGGVIKMTSDLAFGDVVQAFYVARKEQPVGTSFVFNYAFQIAPNEINGIRGQKLIAKYHLGNPDTFFYRVESVKSFIPEVVKELASSSGGSSGPSTSSQSSLQTKDYGAVSLHFDEQHLRNLDVVVARLLQFFNDQANYYEDMLADFDGRVVGGSSGRMRFNGDVSGVKRNSYAEVQNDIDDQVKLYDGVVLVSFSPITFSEGPVFGPIWDYNALSRFYGTSRPSVPVALNDKVTPILDFGKTMGSIGISNLTSVSMLATARSRSKFVALEPTKTQLTLPGTNGDPKTLVPPFYANQKVKYYGPDGVETGSGTVSSISASTPAVVTVSPAVTTLSGSIMADTSDPDSDGVRFYREGDHISVDYENGQVSNAQLPPPFGPTEVMEGNEVMETNVTFVNRDVTPKRIPVLDGQELTDHGAVSFPPLTYKNELFALSLEAQADQSIATCTITGLSTVTNCFLPLATGSVVKVVTGLNAGQVRVVQNFIPPSTFTTTAPFPFIDPSPQTIYSISHLGDIPNLVADIVGIVQTNSASAPASPAIIGGLNSQLKALENAILSFGPNLVHRPSGTVITPDVLRDTGAGFLTLPVPVTNSCFLYVASGPNQGVYKLKEVNSNELKVDTAAPYGPFPAVGLVSQDYYVIQPWQFVTKKQPEFAAEFIRSALAWVAACNAWSAGINAAGKPGRLAAIAARVAEINGFVGRVQGLLRKDEKIYDTRYLWIKQRIDRKEGLVVKIGQAAAKRQEALDKLLSDQQKKLIASQIA